MSFYYEIVIIIFLHSFFLHCIFAVKIKLHCVKPKFKNLKRDILVINFLLKLNENISTSNYLNTCEQFIIFIIALKNINCSLVKFFTL